MFKRNYCEMCSECIEIIEDTLSVVRTRESAGAAPRTIFCYSIMAKEHPLVASSKIVIRDYLQNLQYHPLCFTVFDTTYYRH